MVSSFSNIQSDLQNLAQTNGRHIYYQNESKTSTLCLTSPRCKCTEHRCIEHLLGGSGWLCLLSCSSHSKCHSKMNTYRCKMIVVAPGWPRMHWFWYLVNLSTKPPLQLPHWHHLLKQLFSQIHVWHLDTTQKSESLESFSEQMAERIKASQKNSHLGKSMSQGGPFLNSGANRITWSAQSLLSQT